MEVGSEALLQPDGKFKWYLAVGAFKTNIQKEPGGKMGHVLA